MRRFRTVGTRIPLFWLNLLGPIVRSAARERVKWQFAPLAPQDRADTPPQLKLEGTITFAPGMANGARPIDRAALLESCRRSLIRRDTAVAVTDGFQTYDLQMVVPPALRVAINALQRDNGRFAIRWKLGFAWQRIGIAVGCALLLLIIGGLGVPTAIVAVALGLTATVAFAWTRARRISPLMREAALDTAFEIGASAEDLLES